MIRTIRLRHILLLLAFGAAPGFSQVKVTVKLDQPDYLVGEPVVVIVDVTNIGTRALGYSECDGHANLTVPGGQLKATPHLLGCNWGVGGSFGCGVGDPPQVAPGQTISFRYLLKGYSLQSGAYVLHASGRAGVSRAAGPVEGAAFDVSLNLNLWEATEDELRQRYVHYVNEAASGSGMTFGPAQQARQAIAEMAPPFLEKTILGFANQPQTANLAVEGLGQIPTAESRADLLQLYDKSEDLKLRALIVEKLAGIATPRELGFFSSLLAGHSSTLEDAIRVFAALGIGRLGGEDAVKALASAPPSPNPELSQAVATALGNTRSPAAIPILVGMYADERARNSVCGALGTLTHYKWCDGAGSVPETQAKWREWWSSRASSLKLYGNDECVEMEALRPLVN